MREVPVRSCKDLSSQQNSCMASSVSKNAPEGKEPRFMFTVYTSLVHGTTEGYASRRPDNVAR